MKRLVFCLVLLCTAALGQDVLLRESFDGTWSTTNPPTGWQILWGGDTSTNDWHRADPNSPRWPGNPTPFALLDSAPGEAGEDYIATPLMDFRGASGCTLRCSLAIRPGNGSATTVGVMGALEPGNFSIPLLDLKDQTAGPQLFTIDMSWAQGDSDAQVAFYYIGGAGGLEYWCVDNVTITGRFQSSDVGVTALLAPGDTVDSGAAVVPRARVRNFDSRAGTFYVHFRAALHHDSVLVTALPGLDSTEVTFGTWTADTFGSVVVDCRTQLPGDVNPVNDGVSVAVFVKPSVFRDAEARAILAPVGRLVESTLVVPSGVVGNNGNRSAVCTISLALREGLQTFYTDTVTRLLPIGATDTVAFEQWTAFPRGGMDVVFRVALQGDINPDNDELVGRVSIVSPFHDVGAARLLAPADTVPPGSVAPAVAVYNYGTFTEGGFYTRCRVFRDDSLVYYDSAVVAAVAPLETLAVHFRNWTAARGRYTIRCTTALAGDAAPANDRITRNFVVAPPILPGWQELESLPGPTRVKDGGALAFLPSLSTVYALRGKKTDEFLRYSIAERAWGSCQNVPPGTGGKPVNKGGALVCDGRDYVYATKGNNTSSFLLYDVYADTWTNLPDVPLGPTDKKVKGGTSMQYSIEAGGEYVYLLKGYRNEFWRFNVGDRVWESLPPAPLGPSGKTSYKAGSFIVLGKAGTIWCVRARYNDLFAFDLAGDTWHTTPHPGLPFIGRLGRSKKVGDGAGGAWWNGGLYCLKGYNTQEFWRFKPATDSWKELDTIPAYGSTGRRKRVKAGGSLVGTGDGLFYATKGNKTNEFWLYKSTDPVGVEELPPLPVARRGVATIARGVLYLPPGPRAVPGLLLDAAGRRVLALRPGPNSVHSLAPGVYFVTRGSDAVAKVVLQR